MYWSNHVDLDLAGPASHPRPVAMGPGVPAELEGTLEVLTWNDPESFVRLMDLRGGEVAAVLTEPAVFNTGCILPEPGYLELLRSEGTDERLLNATVEVTDDDGEIVLEFPFAEALLDNGNTQMTKH